MAMNDLDINQEKAKLWVQQVQELCSKVDREVEFAKAQCNMDGVGTGQEGDDFLIDVMLKTATFMESSWKTCISVCKEGWDILGNAINLVGNAGDEIGELFGSLHRKF